MEDKPLFTIEIFDKEGDTFVETLGLDEKRLMKISSQVKGIMYLHDNTVGAMDQVIREYRVPNELAFAMYMLGCVCAERRTPNIQEIIKVIIKGEKGEDIG